MKKSIIVNCPKCNQKLKIPYLEGKRLKVKCRICNNSFEYFSPKLKKNLYKEIKENIDSFLYDIKPYIPDFYKKFNLFLKNILIKLKYNFGYFLGNIKYTVHKLKNDSYYRKNILKGENSALYILIILILIFFFLRLLVRLR
ncbi:MAG: hypothetical protein N3A58_01165 [Spirochaetes bacterium]|nr:hypothetical protein [Spirochaetota bacterium]